MPNDQEKSSEKPQGKKKLIDQANARLEAGQSTTSILTDPSFLQVHEWPRFRKLIRKWARSSTVKLVTSKEPGEALVVVAPGGTVGEATAKPGVGQEPL